ncbi:MAG: zinc-dependent alcohol dehydrogenase [Thermoplasmata archaeon]|nr:alcohol dehydrogenase catalytic domain-containing protein [Thermoplasmata archaeon]
MRAACYYGPRNIKIEDMEIPEINDDEVLIETYTIGICPTDIRYYLGLRGESTYDNEKFTTGKDTYGLSGHEAVGKIVKIGKNVKKFKIGDFVVHETFTYCGECEFCKEGKINLCPNKKDIARGYSEYFKVPYKFLHLLPEDIDIDDAAFAEPLAVVLHAVKKVKNNSKDVAVIGAGPMGILISFALKLNGIDPAILEINENRRKFANELGFKNTINPEEEDFKNKIELITKYGFDGVISSIGGKGPFNLGLSITKPGGMFIIFGGTYPKDYIQLDPNAIHYSEKIITGSSDHDYDDMEEAIEIIRKREIPLKKIVTKKFSLNELNNAFESVISGNEMKVQIKVK